MENQNQPNQVPQPQEIRIADNFSGGEYANAMQVSHNKEEFLLNFFNIIAPGGRVVAKLN